MKKKTTQAVLSLLAFCSTLITLGSGYANSQQHWDLASLFKHHNAALNTAQADSMWPLLGKQFRLSRSSQHPAVQQQVRWFTKHPSYIHELTRNAKPYLHYVYQETKKRGMPVELALLPMIESNYNPFAYSHTGAAGLWQLMPGTATGFGVRINWWYDGRRDIIASTNAALNYLQYLHDYFNDWLLAIAAYNSGEGTVLKAIRYNQRRHQPTNFWALKLPKETKQYVPKLLALAKIVHHPQQYQLRLDPVDNKPYFSTVRHVAQIQLNHLAELASTDLKTIRQLNPGFRRSKTAPDHAYYILMPSDKVATFRNNLKHQVLAQNKQEATQHLHQVRPKETLSGIAKQFNTSVLALRQQNHLTKDFIKVGQRLTIPKPSNMLADAKLNATITEDHMPGPKRIDYRIKPHDSIRGIAHKFKVKPQEIYYWNKLSPRNKLKPSQVLVIWHKNKKHHSLVNSQLTYRVKSGDNLSTIAIKFNTSTRHIRHANKLSGDAIRIGQQLIIPA